MLNLLSTHFKPICAVSYSICCWKYQLCELWASHFFAHKSLDCMWLALKGWTWRWLPLLVWDGPCKGATNAWHVYELHLFQAGSITVTKASAMAMCPSTGLEYLAIHCNTKKLEKHLKKTTSPRVRNEGFSQTCRSLQHWTSCSPKWTALEAGHVYVITAIDLLNTGSQEIPTTTPKAMITSLPAHSLKELRCCKVTTTSNL